MDDIFGTPSVQSTPQPIATHQPSISQSNPLDDIFGTSAPKQPAPQLQPLPVHPIYNPSPTNLYAAPPQNPLDSIFGAPSLPNKEASLIAHEDPQLRVDFKLTRDSNPAIHKITAIFSNKSPGLISDLNMLVSVKKYLTLNLFAVSSSTLAPGAPNAASQAMTITNTQEGSQPLALRIKITYKVNGSPFEHTKVIDQFPAY